MKKLLVAALFAGLLVGCGGGDSGSDRSEANQTSVEVAKVVVDEDQLERRDGLMYFEEKPFTGVAGWGDGGQEAEFTYKDGKRDGLVTGWYSYNGQKWNEYTYKDGKLDGLFTKWYSNGQKEYENTYKDGNLVTTTAWKPNGEKCPNTNFVNGNGIMCWYHDNGQKGGEATFKDGKQDGLWTRWHENGQKKREENRKDGKLDGLLTEWYENGQKKAEITYKDGKYISEKAWDEDGNPK